MFHANEAIVSRAKKRTERSAKDLRAFSASGGSEGGTRILAQSASTF
jgi:hypothetical protein